MTSARLRHWFAQENKLKGEGIIMSDMDRRAFVGAAALGGVAAAVLTAPSAMAAGQSGYFVIAEIVSKKDKADDLRALLVPFAEKSTKEPGCSGLHADGSDRRTRPLPDLRTVDGQGCPRGAHGYTGHQGNRAKAGARSGKAIRSAFPRRAHRRLSRKLASTTDGPHCSWSGPERRSYS